MSFKKRAAVAVAGALAGAAMISGLVAPNAFAMYRVLGIVCNGSEQYWTTFSTTGNTCWANDGSVNVTLYQVALLSSGNNRGGWECTAGSFSIPSYSSQNLVPYGYPTITWMVITGR